MFSTLSAFLALNLLTKGVDAHPTKYPKLNQPDCTGNPDILSFHTHIIYMVTDEDQIDRAMQLREVARKEFADIIGEDCDARFDNGHLCMINDHDFNTTLEGGPFPSGEWSMFVPVSYYANVMPWFTQNRGEFSFLIHPNTGCEYEDHTKWTLWGGDKWPLDTAIFTENKQQNEFNNTRGDAANPICLSENAVCSGVGGEGPAGVCCESLACHCQSADMCRCAAH